MGFYRTVPKVVQAVNYNGENKEEIIKLLGEEPTVMPFIDNWLVKEGDTFIVMDEEEFKERYETIC